MESVVREYLRPTAEPTLTQGTDLPPKYEDLVDLPPQYDESMTADQEIIRNDSNSFPVNYENDETKKIDDEDKNIKCDR